MNKQRFYVVLATIALVSFLAAPCAAMDGQPGSSGNQNTEQAAQAARQRVLDQLGQYRERAAQAYADELSRINEDGDTGQQCCTCRNQIAQENQKILRCPNAHWVCKSCFYRLPNGICPVCRQSYATSPTDIRSGDDFLRAIAGGDIDDVSYALAVNPALIHFRGYAGLTALTAAAESGDLEMVQLLLARQASFGINGSGRTPLMAAVHHGHEAVARLLIERGEDPSERDYQGKTSLMVAAEDKNEAMVRLLIENGADVFKADDQGKTALDRAGDHQNITQLLEVSLGLSRAAMRLFPAIREGNVGDVAKALEILPNLVNQQAGAFYKTSLLAEAVKHDRQEIAQLLISKGARVNDADDTGKTPLMRAVESGNLPMARLLAENGANVDEQCIFPRLGVDTYLSMIAAERGDQAMVNLLLEQGARVDQKNKQGWTLLMWAANKGQEAVARLLLAKGAFVDGRSNVGMTPLMQAAAKGHIAIVRLLIENHANINEQNVNGGSPLMWAVDEGHIEIVRLLLEHGARVNQRDHDGWTPIMFAACQGYEEIARLLIESNANVHQKNNLGKTALDKAKERGQLRIVPLLEQAMRQYSETSTVGSATKRRRVKGNHE